MSPSYPAIARAIRSARLRKGWSQEQAARHIGVSRFHWIRWEQGLHKPTVEHQGALVAMGVDPAVFDDNDEQALRLGRVIQAAIREVALA